jgi:basic membrane lipoprotein Med (substrate-binding protein (PBP1-ABC) superfamily)
VKITSFNRRGNPAPRRIAALVAGLAVAGLALTACSSGSGTASETAAADGPKVALLTSVGLKDSGLGRQTQEAGDTIAEQFGADVDVQGDIAADTWAEAYRNYASRGYDLIIVNDITGQAAALEVGAEFPETDFVVLGGYDSLEPNVSAVSSDFRGGGYLAGIVAGAATETGKVAGIGADDSIAPIKDLMEGFAEGVKSVNPTATVDLSYTGIPTGDPIKATQQATAVLDGGADVIFGVANGGQPGLFQAAADAGAMAIGYGVDENDLAPETVITSLVSDVPGSVVRVMERYEAGTLAPEVVVEGYAEDAFQLADFRGLLTDEQISTIEAAVAAHTAG